MTGRSNHERLALHIVWGTRVDDDTPAADARELLAMCGLIAPDGHEVLPDPESRREVDGLDGEGFQFPTTSSVEPKITDRPRASSAPPGLRDYVPPPEPPKRLKRIPEVADPEPAPSPDGPLDLGPDFDLPPDPAPEPEPALSRPLPEPVRVPVLNLTPEHGTPEGARALHKGESLCVRCQQAVDRAVVITTQADNHPGPNRIRTKPRPAKKAQPAKRKRQVGEKKPPTITAQCGQRGGYDAHHTRGEHACQPCKDVATARWRAAQERRTGRPVTPRAEQPAKEPAAPTPPDGPANTAPATPAAPEPTPVPDVVPLRPATPGHDLAAELDEWFAASQRHDDPAVRRAANLAIAHLIQLRVAMDDLARAERRSRTTTHPTAGAQP